MNKSGSKPKRGYPARFTRKDFKELVAHMERIERESPVIRALRALRRVTPAAAPASPAGSPARADGAPVPPPASR